MNAKTGDAVQAITCHCGTQLVASWGVPNWSCSACKQRGRRGPKYRLLDVGWEPIPPEEARTSVRNAATIHGTTKVVAEGVGTAPGRGLSITALPGGRSHE